MTFLKSLIRPLVLTGLISGTLDEIAACAMYYFKTGDDVLIVFRFIASGVLRTRAFSGGVQMALIGVVFHYVIAFGWTILFFLLAARIRVAENWIFSGIVYGVLVWLVMNLIVVPLSHVPITMSHTWIGILKGTLTLVICIGLPVSYAANKHIRERI